MTILLPGQYNNTSRTAERKQPAIVDATILPWPMNADESDRQRDPFAKQAADVRSPRIGRLGEPSTRQSLQDTLVRARMSKTYRDIFDYVTSQRQSDRACMKTAREAVIRILRNNGISAEVKGRIKSVYSTYMKTRALEHTAREVMDRIGIRIIVRSVPECYRVLDLLHMHFMPIAGTFDDYIANPKDNGYQCLHTCVYALKQTSSKPIEFQVRTTLMHRNAETGNASHRRYKIRTETQIDLSEQTKLSGRLWFLEMANRVDSSPLSEDEIKDNPMTPRSRSYLTPIDSLGR